MRWQSVESVAPVAMEYAVQIVGHRFPSPLANFEYECLPFMHPARSGRRFPRVPFDSQIILASQSGKILTRDVPARSCLRGGGWGGFL